MHPRLFSRVTRAAVAALLLLAVGAQTAAARPEPGARRSRGFDLFAGPFQYFLVNRVYCGINAVGEFCVDPTNSSTIAGGFWPRGTPNPYIFNSGLQLAGVIAADAGFAWAGDTVGAYFFDARGDQAVGEAVINLHSSLDADDVANWPAAGIVRDTAIYNAALVFDQNGVPLNRPAVSQQDIWGRAWDGNTNLGAGREHPMGILTDTRAMAWSFPTGNEDILYFAFDFYNITASDPSVYANLDPAIRDDIAAIGAQFQANSEDAFGVDIPAGGYTIAQAYAAFSMDPDVDAAGSNSSTAILPFSLATAYKTNWVSEEGFAYPPDVHGPPFAAAPGMVGVKYLKSPGDPVTGVQYGLTMFSNTENSGTGFPDPIGTQQLWRYLSGRVSTQAGDNSCTVPNPVDARLCYLGQVPIDTRFYLASGPFDLVPGQKFTIVVAYIHAAVPAAAITIGTNMLPGIPPSATDLGTGAATERPIDRAAGWVSHSDVDGNGTLSQDEVETFPRSLLNKSLVAQEVYDKKFLLPAPPDAPNFFLIPGNNQVTVVWEPSASEDTGDPFYGIASDPTSALFDPNFRQYDVEGYRIYRGRSQSDLTLIAQFDYENTYFRDYTGGVVAGGNCAPELGIYDDCLENFDFPISNTGAFHDFDIVGDLIQVPAGGRVELADGSVFIINADTAGTTNVALNIPLTNTGVPFAYVDRGVLNSITYVYAVTAYDINAVNSGPTSLESAQILQNVVPRKVAVNQVAAAPVQVQLLGGDGTVLDPTAAGPSIDAANGTFSGPAGPSGALTAVFELFSDIALQPDFEAVFQVDSVIPSWYHVGTYYFSIVDKGTGSASGSGDPLGLGTDQELGPYTLQFPADANAAASAGFEGLPASGRGLVTVNLYSPVFQSKDADWHQDVDGSFFDFAGVSDVGGSRWFDGDNETLAEPTLVNAHGQLTGVTTIYRPVRIRNASNLFRRFDQTNYHVFRAADMKVYWGAGGRIDSVIDVTHRIAVPFSGQYRASWGVLQDFSGASNSAPTAPEGVLTYNDFLFGACLPGAAGVSQTGCASRNLVQTATLAQVDVTGDLAADGTGFGLYINGEPFIFQAAALPASGTVWTLRTYMGDVQKGDDGSYSFTPYPANAPIPGLRLVLKSGAAASYPDDVAPDLSNVHTVPDPYYVTNNMEITTNRKVLKFVNLPTKAIIRIYSLSGILVDVVEHNDPSGGGEATWDLRNRNEQFVASGVYFYHVETPSGEQKVGRFTVVQFAQ
jgi:hypothetical protein